MSKGKVKICFLYDGTGFSQSAERGATIIELNKVIFSKQGLNGSIDAEYIGITQNEKYDFKILTQTVCRGYKVFCSALGSTIVQYLENIFFNQIPESYGIVHINSYSTSIELDGIKNLIRFMPTDIYTPQIFVYAATESLTQKNNGIVIIYNPGNIFSESLANQIDLFASSEQVPHKMVAVLDVPNPPGFKEQINSLTPFPGDNPTTVLIISNFAPEYTGLLIDTNIDQIYPGFSLMYTDANANMPNVPPHVLHYMGLHNATLLQYFFTEHEIDYIIEIGIPWNTANPDHRVSASTIQYIKAIEGAILLTKTKQSKRNNLQLLSGITLNKGNSNNNYAYGLYNFLDFPTIRLVELFYVLNGKIFTLNDNTQ
jgi:hypothetical protein